MNKARAMEAIKDLVDCTSIYQVRCTREGYSIQGDELKRIATTINNRFVEVTSKVLKVDRPTSWSILYHSLEKCKTLSEELRRRGLIAEDEMYFIFECVEEVHKFIRRRFAKRGEPRWRRGA